VFVADNSVYRVVILEGNERLSFVCVKLEFCDGAEARKVLFDFGLGEVPDRANIQLGG